MLSTCSLADASIVIQSFCAMAATEDPGPSAKAQAGPQRTFVVRRRRQWRQIEEVHKTPDPWPFWWYEPEKCSHPWSTENTDVDSPETISRCSVQD